MATRQAARVAGAAQRERQPPQQEERLEKEGHPTSQPTRDGLRAVHQAHEDRDGERELAMRHARPRECVHAVRRAKGDRARLGRLAEDV